MTLANRGLFKAILLVVAALTGSPAPTSGAPAPPTPAQLAALDLSAASHQRVAFSAMKRSGRDKLAASVLLGTELRTLMLEPHDLRGPETKLYGVSAGGVRTEVALPPAQTYRGRLAEEEGAVVAASYEEGRMRALIRRADGRLWCIQPVPGIAAADAETTHAVFDATDLLATGASCGTADEGALESSGHEETSGPGLAAAGPGLYVATIAFDADYEYYLANGSSVPDTMTDIENVMNGVNIIYERDTQITHVLGAVLVRTDAADPYVATESSEVLSEFAAEWNANQGAVERDIAHMMTGKDMDGSTIGRAYIGVICSSYLGYGISQSRFSSNFARRVGLTAHELGHNWDAGHCDCNIMCASIGGCLNDVTTFAQASVDAIVAHRNSRGCLLALLPDLAVTVGAAPANPVTGTELTYTFWVTNSGTVAGTGLELVSAWPEGMSFVSSSPGAPACVATGHLLTCDLGALPVGAATGLAFTVSTALPGCVTNTTTVTAAEGDVWPADNTVLRVDVVTPVLSVLPVTGLASAGPQGGRHLPACTSYTLRNQGAAARAWTTTTAGGLVAVEPASGVIAAGASTGLTVCLEAGTDAFYQGDYSDTVYITDLAGGWVEARDVSLSIEPVALMPFAEDCEAGALDPYWRLSGTGDYRTRCTTEDGPYEGGYHLTMDDSVAGGDYSRNEATLRINLEGYTNVWLSFWAREYGDESHAPPQPFVDGADFDGVAVSEDGETWYEVQSLRGLTTNYAPYLVDLDAAVNSHGLAYTRAFHIRFNQYDNYPIASDGLALDNIVLTGEGPAADFDGDGMPDSWEARFFGGGTNGTAGADSDADGLNNLEEFVADLDPTNGAVGLTFCVERPEGDLLRALITASSTQRLYHLDATSDLGSGAWSNVVGNIRGSNGTTTVTAPSGGPARFYRLRVLAP